MRLRTSLWLLSAATAIPLLVLAILAAVVVAKGESDNLVNAAKARNRATMSAVDAELRGAISALQALSGAASLERNDLATFHRDATAVLATQPSWSNVLLHDPTGRQLVNVSLPLGTQLLDKVVAPKSFEAVLRTRQPAVDDLAAAPLLQYGLGIPVRVPLIRSGKVAYVLTAVVSTEALQGLLENQQLPEGWVTGLVDNEGRLIARVPPKPVGTMAAQTYLDKIEGAYEGAFYSSVLEGTQVFSTFVRSPLTGWTVGYAIPVQALYGGHVRAAWLMVAGIALSLLVAALIGYWLSLRISKPMAQLADAAALLGKGVLPPAISSTVSEVERLSLALGEAAKAIDSRDRDLRRSEAELRQQAADLRRADINKTQFLALLSHELRNPLAPLRNGIALLKMRSDAQGIAETQAMMERQVTYLNRLIDDLLDVSRIDRGQLELRRERVAVDAVVRNAIETAKPAVEAKQHELVVRYAPEALFVDGDPIRLSQVVSNLLSNAAKFTPPRGRIEIATRIDGNAVCISVKDNGIGFPPEQASSVFGMFVQLDGSRSQAAGGLGIGLSLARSLVEMHGGRIEAQSAGPGQGAMFTVHLPVAAVPEAAAPAPSLARLAKAKCRVLVVDDNVDATDSLAQILVLEGFEVRRAYDGAQALEIASRFKPDVAFVDLNMPGMSGNELATALKAQPWSGGLRLIALTGMGQQTDIEATRAAGFHAHITKPAAADEILRLVAGPIANVVPLHAQRQTSYSLGDGPEAA